MNELKAPATISTASALVASFLGTPSQGVTLAREVAKALELRPSDLVTTEIASLMLLTALLGGKLKAAVASASTMLGFEAFAAFRFSYEQDEPRAETVNVPPEHFPRTVAEAMNTLINADRLGISALSRPFSIEAGTRYDAPFVVLTMQQTELGSDNRSHQVEITYAAPGQTRIATYQVPNFGRWGMSACGGAIFSRLAKHLGPISVTGGGGIPQVAQDFQVDPDEDEKPLAAQSHENSAPIHGNA